MQRIIKWSLGIDVGSKNIHCCLSSIDETQSVKAKRSRKFTNTAGGLHDLLDWLNKNYAGQQAPLSVTMEATGIYYERCALFLQKEGFRVSVILPTKAKNYLRSIGLKSKNDKIDAQGLARMGAEQLLQQWSGLSSRIYALRLLTRQHEDLQKSLTSFTNQLHAVSNGMYSFEGIEATYRQAIANLLELLSQVEKGITQAIGADEDLHKKVAHLCSVKGVGQLTAATIIAETNGFELFVNQKQLESFAGYDVVENQSGNHIGKTKISKKGNTHIRRILHMPALNMVTYKVKPFVDLYERVVQRTGIKMKGYVAVQRKLLVLLYTLYKKDQDYDISYYLTSIGEKEPEPSLA